MGQSKARKALQRTEYYGFESVTTGLESAVGISVCHLIRVFRSNDVDDRIHGAPARSAPCEHLNAGLSLTS
jgi:hypothetical protein